MIMWPAESRDQSNKGYHQYHTSPSTVVRRYRSRPMFSLLASILMSEEDWENIGWSDENKVELFGENSTRHVWRKNAGLHLKNIIPTVRHCGGKHQALCQRGRTTDLCWSMYSTYRITAKQLRYGRTTEKQIMHVIYAQNLFLVC